MHKCEFPEGLIIKPDGENELDPCIYDVDKVFTNCFVEICKCKKCGNISICWYRTADTQELTGEEFEDILQLGGN